MVPMRAIFEALGANVNWEQKAQTVTSQKDGVEIKLTIGQHTAYKNGEALSLDSVPVIVSNRTLVPIRFVAESFGADVEWDGYNRTVTISTAGTNTDTTGDTNIDTITVEIPSHTLYTLDLTQDDSVVDVLLDRLRSDIIGGYLDNPADKGIVIYAFDNIAAYIFYGTALPSSEYPLSDGKIIVISTYSNAIRVELR
jgi:hypothetical protein